MFWTIVGGLLLLALYHFRNGILLLCHLHPLNKVLAQFPTTPYHWFLGHFYYLPGLNDAGLEYYRTMVAKHPRCCAVWDTCIMGFLGINHPDLMKEILKRSDPKPTDHGEFSLLKDWIGEGLISSNGQKWHRNRRLITHAFHKDILKTYISVFNKVVDTLEGKLNDHAESKSGVPLLETMSSYALDAMLQTTMSYTDNIQHAGASHPYVRACEQLTMLYMKRLMSIIGYLPIWKFTSDGKEWTKHCNFVRGMGTEVIQKRRQQLKSHTTDTIFKKYQDLLDMLLIAKDDDEQGLTDEEILDEVSTFMVAGHDTTASSLSWILYDLASHPDYQQMCRQEVDQVLEQHDDPHTTWDDLFKFPFLTQCIKESLRLHTVVPFITRELKEDMMIDDRLAPAGTSVSLSLYMLHHNPQIWPDSMEYTPDRFSSDNVAKMDPFAFLPFSAGSRNCIGQNFSMFELKVAVSRILRRFEMSIPHDQVLETEIGIVTKPSKAILINFTKRADSM